MRKNYFLNLMLVIGLLLLVGCAENSLKPEKLAQIKRVGVVSLAANKLERQYVGLTVFGNEHEELDISSWGVDAEYEQAMLRALKKEAPFEVTTLVCDRHELEQVIPDVDVLYKPNASVEEKIRLLASQNSVDAIILLTDYAAGSGSLRVGGAHLSVYFRSDIRPYIALSASAHLIDGKSGKTIKGVRLLRNGDPNDVERQPTPIIWGLTQEVARLPLTEMGEKRKAEIRSLLLALPKDAWEYTLLNKLLSTKKNSY